MPGHARLPAEPSAPPPSDGASSTGLDLGLDALLEDDRLRGASAGLGAARRLGQAALQADEFLSPTQRRAVERANRPTGPATSVFHLEGEAIEVAPPQPRRSRGLLLIAVVAAVAAAAIAVLQLA